jgi:hypothetical protein
LQLRAKKSKLLGHQSAKGKIIIIIIIITIIINIKDRTL